MISPQRTTSAPDAERDESEYLPARMLNEYAYCPRLFYLEHVDGLFAHNADTIEGVAKHTRVDKKTTSLPASKRSTSKRSKSAAEADKSPDDGEDAIDESIEREVVHARSVTLSSDRYGVLAKLDLVESDGITATPVDYKRGAPKTLDDGTLSAWDPERVQLCVQALVLRENGFECSEGVLFFWETRQRVRIAIDEELIKLTEAVVEGARLLRKSDVAPPPLVDSPKCPRCSLVGICLPDETSFCRHSPSGDELLQPMLFDIGPTRLSLVRTDAAPKPNRVRQMVTARDERRPLYLNSQGYSLGKSGDVLQAKDKGKLVQEFRLHDVSQVNVMGNIQVTTQAIQSLLQAEIPLIYFSYGGWFYGMTQGVGLKNIMWRREQFRAADRPEFCLRLARKLVSAKIQNQRTLLMRNHIEPPSSALNLLKSMKWESERADSISSLLGIEGFAARVYFEHFEGMIKANRDLETGASSAAGKLSSADTWLRFDFEGRNRRPPRDPVNAMLSLGYSLLAKDLTIACASVGLDPYLGYYHQPRYGRPSLALDLMEPFRPLVVDSAVISAINNRMIEPKHFVSAGDSVALTADGRKVFFRAYEQRMDQLATHPLFDYRVSYRRMLEIQTRLLARCLTGEIWDYPTFVTR